MAVVQADLVDAVQDVIQAQRAAVTASGVYATRVAQLTAASSTVEQANTALTTTQKALLDLIGQFASQ